MSDEQIIIMELVQVKNYFDMGWMEELMFLEMSVGEIQKLMEHILYQKKICYMIENEKSM